MSCTNLAGVCAIEQELQNCSVATLRLSVVVSCMFRLGIVSVRGLDVMLSIFPLIGTWHRFFNSIEMKEGDYVLSKIIDTEIKNVGRLPEVQVLIR